ncbi:MAG: hypothetical protein KKH08_04165 [Candidatus Omnitrophica bacterium]|nr:hypothetical protein [Candidatus Omnitrophota bacterium]
MRKKRLSLQDKAYKAMKEAVHEVVKRHERTGRPLAIWQNGRVVRVSAKQVLRKNGK